MASQDSGVNEVLTTKALLLALRIQLKTDDGLSSSKNK